MNILHVIETLDPAAGGPATVAPRLAAAQSALGHDVTILCFARPDRDGAIEQALANVPGIDHVRRLELPRPPRWRRHLLSSLRPRIRSIVRGADFVHLHGMWETLLLYASQLARRADVPYAVRPAGMLDPWSLAQKRCKKRIALALGYRAMLDGAAWIHTLNADEARLIEPLRLRAASHIIGNGVFFEELQPLPEYGTFRALHPQLRGSRFILFLGRLHEKKGLDILVDAFGQLGRNDDQAHLVIAGPDEGVRRSLEWHLEELGLTRRVHLVGPLYGRDKLAAFRDAAVFCLPSRQEGFSLATLEALACGVPVVISEDCHFAEVADAGAGRVIPLDAGAVADALGSLLSDPARRAAMAHAGRNLVRSRYTWSCIARQVVAVVRQSVC